MQLIRHFRVPKPPIANLSCENEFYLHDNKKSFSQERFCTWPRFKAEACGISQMGYWLVAKFEFASKLQSKLLYFRHNL